MNRATLVDTPGLYSVEIDFKLSSPRPVISPKNFEFLHLRLSINYLTITLIWYTYVLPIHPIPVVISSEVNWRSSDWYGRGKSISSTTRH